LKAELEEASSALGAAHRLSDQLDRKEAMISALRDEGTELASVLLAVLCYSLSDELARTHTSVCYNLTSVPTTYICATIFYLLSFTQPTEHLLSKTHLHFSRQLSGL